MSPSVYSHASADRIPARPECFPHVLAHQKSLFAQVLAGFRSTALLPHIGYTSWIQEAPVLLHLEAQQLVAAVGCIYIYTPVKPNAWKLTGGCANAHDWGKRLFLA